MLCGPNPGVKDSSLVGIICQLRLGCVGSNQTSGSGEREDRESSRQRAQPGQGRAEHGPGQERSEVLGGDMRDRLHGMGWLSPGPPVHHDWSGERLGRCPSFFKTVGFPFSLVQSSV